MGVHTFGRAAAFARLSNEYAAPEGAIDGIPAAHLFWPAATALQDVLVLASSAPGKLAALVIPKVVGTEKAMTLRATSHWRRTILRTDA